LLASLIAMTTWKALTGRITLFPTSAPPTALELFRRVWNADPDSFQKQANPLLPTVAQGMHHGMVAACATQPNRVDFAFSPAPPAEPNEFSVAMIEDVHQLETDLLQIIEAVGQGLISEPVNRVAVNLQLTMPHANSIEANKTLMQIIPEQYRMRLTDEEEFVFRINRIRASGKLPDQKMNFLVTWSVERYQQVALSVLMAVNPMVAQPNVTSQRQGEAILAVTVLLDSNNVPASTRLSSHEQSTLLLEGFHAIANARNEMGLNTTDAL
jgi:hypothetical protein